MAKKDRQAKTKQSPARFVLAAGIVVAILIAVYFITRKEEMPQPTAQHQSEYVFKREGIVTFLPAARGEPRATVDVEIADTESRRTLGLMYRDSLARTHGMLFIFPDSDVRSFWMKNTRIPLDIVFIDDNLTIRSISKNTVPFSEGSYVSEGEAKYVIEVNAGFCDYFKIAPGDKLIITRL